MKLQRRGRSRSDSRLLIASFFIVALPASGLFTPAAAQPSQTGPPNQPTQTSQPSPGGWEWVPDGTLVGRLTDFDGMAVAGATILVFPAEPPLAPAPPAPAGALFRSDADGGFVALLPAGRYTVAAMKDGYDIALTEAHSLSSRVVRMKMKRSPATARRPDTERGKDWLLRPQQADVLRQTAAEVPVQIVLVEAPAPSQAGGESRNETPAPRTPFLGNADGEFMQLFGAGILPGLETTTGGDAVRDTTLSLRAPLSPTLAWSVAGRSLRNPSALSGDDAVEGRSDRLALGLGLDGGEDARLRGRVRAGYAKDEAGEARLSDRVVEAAGDLRLADAGPRLAVALQLWDTRGAAGGPFLPGASSNEMVSGEGSLGEGAAVYAGSRTRVGDAAIDYGFEYRNDSMTRQPHVLPRLGLGYARPGGDPLSVRADLLIDATSPGARCALEAAPRGALQIAAAVAVLPANALDAVAAADAADPAPLRPTSAMVTPAGARSADRREAFLLLARTFGGFSGSLSGTLGRTGPRAVPLVEDGPVPIVSYGNEHFSETRLGVSAARTSTRMELALRRVASEGGDPANGDAAGSAYRRVDVLVAQALPAPRLLPGARLEAMLAWQGMDSNHFDAGTGRPLTGPVTRLTGGVGLSF